MSNSDADWEKWGKIDPYYAVVSHDEFRKDSLQNNFQRFFDTGEAYIIQRLDRYQKHFGTIHKGRALDFGSGVGRLVLPLAARFQEVVGVDISDSMLAEARKNAEDMNIKNVRFVKSDDKLSQAQGVFDFVLSYIVLQHIPLSRGVPIIGQLLDKVAPGGGVSLHFSIWRNDNSAKTAAYWARRKVPGVQPLANVALGRPWGEPLMEMNEYPLAKILKMMNQRGFGDAVVDTESHGSILTATIAAQRSNTIQ